MTTSVQPLKQAFVESYHEQGYVLLRNVLPRAVIDCVRERVGAMVDEAAREMVAVGQISDPHSDLPFERRMAVLGPHCESRVWSLTERIHDYPEPFELVRHPRIARCRRIDRWVRNHLSWPLSSQGEVPG